MRLIAKAIRISRAEFYCNRLTTVQDIQDYTSLVFWAHIVEISAGLLDFTARDRTFT